VTPTFGFKILDRRQRRCFHQVDATDEPVCLLQPRLGAAGANGAPADPCFKAQHNPMRIKIAASNRVCGMRQPLASKKTMAIPPRATRPLLSMFGFILKSDADFIPRQTRSVAR